MKVLGHLLALSFALSTTAPALAGIVDFSDAPVGCTAIAGDRYASEGVLLGTDGAALFLFRSPINANNRFVFGSTDAVQSCGDFGGNANASVIAEFVLPGTLTPGFTDTVSFPIANDGSPTTMFSVSVFGENDILLDTILGGGVYTFNYFRAEGDIHGVVLTPLNSLQALGPLTFGEITLTPTAVPEPTTLLLVAAGVLAATIRRRRYHKPTNLH